MKSNTLEAGKPLLLTVREVQSEIGLGRTNVYELVKSGEIPVVRIGRSIRIPRASLEAWIENKIIENKIKWR